MVAKRDHRAKCLVSVSRFEGPVFRGWMRSFLSMLLSLAGNVPANARRHPTPRSGQWTISCSDGSSVDQCVVAQC